VLQLGVDGPLVVNGNLGRLGDRRGPAPLVDGDPRRDRERPGPQVAAVLELPVAAQGPQERLLERVLGGLATQ
jgi:hypothetical protein